MKIAVIGAGTMGSGIAQLASTSGCEVQLYDVRDEALRIAQENLLKILNRLVEKNKISIFEDDILTEITNKLKLIGFLSVRVDPDGYRPGKINVITD